MRNAISPSIERSRSRRSRYSSHDEPAYRPASVRGSTRCSRDAMVTPGIGLNTTAWIHENTIVFAAMPTASEPMTTAASRHAAIARRVPHVADVPT